MWAPVMAWIWLLRSMYCLLMAVGVGLCPVGHARAAFVRVSTRVGGPRTSREPATGCGTARIRRVLRWFEPSAGAGAVSAKAAAGVLSGAQFDVDGEAGFVDGLPDVADR